jgi:ribosomal protein S18 acetylase RimI-like enzyme
MSHPTPPDLWTVRPAALDDVPAAAKLAAELVRLHHRFDPLRFMRIEPVEEGYARFMRSQVGGDGVVFLVATTARDGRETVVGYTLASLEERDWSDLRDACGKIHDVYVDETARGHGIATRLVGETVARLTVLGAPRVVLMTASQNEDARRLFEHLSFRPTMIEMTRESTPGE